MSRIEAIRILGLFIFICILALVIWNKIHIQALETSEGLTLAVLVAVGDLGMLVLPKLSPGLQKPIFREKSIQPVSQDIQQTTRTKLLDLVEAIWIKGYLDRVLNELSELKLDIRFAEPNKVLQRPALADYELPNTAQILDVFNDLNRRLVIWGEPGAGKTVLLLQLASKLIQEARDDDTKPIPVVLALSSWAAEQPPFEDWLMSELRLKYGVNKKLAERLVQTEKLLYLLDGLDEVAEVHREACLKAIHKFVEDRPVYYVLCCRRAEFEQLETRLKVAGEIVLQPLTPHQINEYLMGAEFDALRSLMHKNSIMRDFARIPFMLNTMAVVTRSKQELSINVEIDRFDSVETLRDYFLESYINRRLPEKENLKYPDFSQTRARLEWLAQQLVKHDQIDFYIENLQPSWLTTESS